MLPDAHKLRDYEIYDHIQRFLKEHSRFSTNTAMAYERDIRKFFRLNCKKNIEHLEIEDLYFTIEEFEDYRDYLFDMLELSATTVNRNIVAVKEIFRYLRRKNVVEDINFIDIKNLPENKKHYGILTREEVFEAAHVVRYQKNGKKNEVKSLLIIFAYDTCSRLSECLSVKWSDIERIGEDIVVKIKRKGNKYARVVIGRTLYEQILTLKKGGEERIFSIHRNSVDRMMDYIIKEMGLQKERNIKFHSFRKAGVNFHWLRTKDLDYVRQIAGHSSPVTTTLYISSSDYGIFGGYSSEEGVDVALYKKIGYKELISAIDALNVDQKLSLNLKIKELELG